MVVSQPRILGAEVQLSTGKFTPTSLSKLAIPDARLHSDAIVHGFVWRDANVNAARLAGDAFYSGSTPTGVIFGRGNHSADDSEYYLQLMAGFMALIGILDPVELN